MVSESGTRPDKKRAGPLQVAKAVFWSFFGIRKSKDHDADAATISPVQVIVAGVIGAALFVLCLVLVVQYVTR
jgi:Protein of unknown function (DUF2970)